MTDLHIPDVSEYQATVDPREQGAIILRAHNGHRPDRTFTERWRQARQASPVRMAYGYVVGSRDPAEQGRETAALIGRLQPGEMVWCDLEEGTGDQSARAEAWCAEVDRICGGRAGVYSGESFFATHLSGVSRTRWVAAYRSSEPRGPHLLWQHTDAERHAGISGPGDCSLFHGDLHSLHDLIERLQGRATSPAHPAPPPRPTPSTSEARMLVLFTGKPEVWEVVGSHLVHVTKQAWQARGLRANQVQHLPPTHPLNSLPKETAA